MGLASREVAPTCGLLYDVFYCIISCCANTVFSSVFMALCNLLQNSPEPEHIGALVCERSRSSSNQTFVVHISSSFPPNANAFSKQRSSANADFTISRSKHFTAVKSPQSCCNKQRKLSCVPIDAGGVLLTLKTAVLS